MPVWLFHSCANSTAWLQVCFTMHFVGSAGSSEGSLNKSGSDHNRSTGWPKHHEPKELHYNYNLFCNVITNFFNVISVEVKTHL